ncbi:MAG: HAMP domain-containing histidine kinase [Candidatus Eremiobacteraeota bacterium]|nr:HAMP domain-containing histidine kinase [Candidatus Eremiobacteraeota bacterium]
MTKPRIELEFDCLANFVHDALAYIDDDGCVEAWSAHCESVTGIASQECLGRQLDEVFLKVEPPLERSAQRAAVKLWARDETRRSLNAAALSLGGGWLLSFGPEQQFSQIDLLRSEIVAAVSHELKTPIATIKAFATTLRTHPVSEAVREDYLQTIEHEADRLTSGVDDLLAAGRVDTEHLPQRREHTPLERIIELALQRLDRSVCPRLIYRGGRTTVFVDANLFSAAVSHVLQNALKFSNDTSLVEVEAEQDSSATVIRVIDRGIGIPEEHMPYIFDRFYRGDSRLTASAGGSGLGLYIARSVVRAHGGSIDVTSAHGSGTTVTMRMPART